MLKNILIYLALLFAAITFNIFFYAWFSWFLLLMIAALPVVSALFSLPFMIVSARSGVSVYTESKVETGSSLSLGVVSNGEKFCFFPQLSVKLTAENSYSKFRKRIKIKTGGLLNKPFIYSGESLCEHVGALRYVMNSCRVYDLMGLFFIPVKYKLTESTLILPKPVKPVLDPLSQQGQIVGYKAKNGGGFSDYYELREYREGDSLKNIHWKASSKYEELIVREPSLPVFRRQAVKLTRSDVPDLNDSIAARFIYAALAFINEQGSVLCCTDSTSGYREVRRREELESFLSGVFLEKPYIDTVTSESVQLYVVTADGEEVSGI